MNAVATRVALTQEVVPGLTPCPMPHATADIIGTARRTARTLDAGATRRTVALIDEHEFTRDCIATCLEMLCPDFAVTLYADLDECVMAGPGRFELVIYHSRGRAAAPGSGSAWLTALGQKLGPATPVLIVSDAEDADMMRQALTAGVRGYITTQNTSLQVTVEVLHLLRAGGTFAPVATSLMQQAQPPPEAASLPPDRFTPRTGPRRCSARMSSRALPLVCRRSGSDGPAPTRYVPLNAWPGLPAHGTEPLERRVVARTRLNAGRPGG